MKKLSMLLLSLLLVLTACGTDKKTEDTKTEETKAETKTVETVKETEVETVKETDAETVGIIEETEIGKRTTLSSKKDITDMIYDDENFNIKINAIQSGKIELTDEAKEMLSQSKNDVSFVVLNMTLENKTDKTLAIYPDQSTIITNTKEQMETNMLASDNLGGDYIGNVVKEGNIVFLLNSKAEDLGKIKLIIGAPQNSNFENLGEDIIFEFEVNK